MAEDQHFSIVLNIMIPFLTTIGTYFVLHFLLKTPRINEALKIIKKSKKLELQQELKKIIGELMVFVSEEMKYMLDDLQYSRWHDYNRRIRNCGEVWKELNHFIELNDSELDPQCVEKTKSMLNFFNDAFILKDKQERLDKKIHFDAYYKKYKEDLLRDREKLETEIRKILQAVKNR